MKTLFYFLCGAVLLCMSACGTSRKATVGQNGMTGSTRTVQVTPDLKTPELSDLKQILVKLEGQKIQDYSTFKAKLKLEYTGPDNSASAAASIRLKKDSVIWVSLTGPFAIEGYRIMIRPDSLILMNKLKHVVMRRSISYLEEIAKLPISFEDLQNIIIGNPLLTKDSLVSYRHEQSAWLATFRSDLFKNMLTVAATGKTVVLNKSQIENETDGRKRSCAIQYGAYQTIPSMGKQFASSRQITLQDQKKTAVKLQFKSFEFNQPVTFPFSIPKSYTEK